ncbi:hypothetical protein ACXYTJ_02390 [Gilvimarinus sp. F26214L]|uniref:hypothetical protein n=1 Tax=Gilvimarinus sp. DZF01 TaxID=3461371 RepID=UPI004045B81D
MKGFLPVVTLLVGLAAGTPGWAQATDGGRDSNLLLALAQMAGMHVCDHMRDRFRNLETGSREGESATSGTLWMEDCAAHVDGTRLSIALGGQGWRWVYRVKQQAGADFELSQYATFAVDVRVEGNLDAGYDEENRIFHFWFKPLDEPTVSFRPIGDVDVDTEGLWSSVVGGAASLFSRSPDDRAREQLQAVGRENLKEKFSEGFTASLNFCTGRLDVGLGINGEDAAEPDMQEESIQAYMHEGGLILDGPYDVDPRQFAVNIEGDGPMLAELMCVNEAVALARAFVEQQPLPEVRALNRVETRGNARFGVDTSYVSCPVVLALRPLPGAGETSFGFQYQVHTAPLMEPLEQCE